MHDTILLNKISKGLENCCKDNKIVKINKLTVIFNEDSCLNPSSLMEYLRSYNGDLVGEWTEINTETGDLPSQTAIIRNIEGDVSEK